METPTNNIKDILIGDTTLSFKDTLHIGREPDGEGVPDNIVSLFDTPNSGSQLVGEKNSDGNNTDRYEYAAIQVRVRNKSYDKAMKKAKEIVEVLHERGNETINNTKITLINALDNPSLLDWDSNNRARVVVNFEVHQTKP